MRKVSLFQGLNKLIPQTPNIRAVFFGICAFAGIQNRPPAGVFTVARHEGTICLFNDPSCKAGRTHIVEAGSFAVLDCKLLAGGLTTIIQHTFHNAERILRKDRRVIQQTDPLLCSDARIIVCFAGKPLGFLLSDCLFLKIIAAQVETKIDGSNIPVCVGPVFPGGSVLDCMAEHLCDIGISTQCFPKFIIKTIAIQQRVDRTIPFGWCVKVQFFCYITGDGIPIGIIFIRVPEPQIDADGTGVLIVVVPAAVVVFYAQEFGSSLKCSDALGKLSRFIKQVAEYCAGCFTVRYCEI